MSVSLNEILDLVGPLDDSAGENTPRERFRRFLRKNVHEVGEIRDHIEQCLRTSGEQYNRALQDLVNYVGEFLGFKVEFGRYRGVQNEIGFDGLWQSPFGLNLVVEVKTTEVYAIKAATLVGYPVHKSINTVPAPFGSTESRDLDETREKSIQLTTCTREPARYFVRFSQKAGYQGSRAAGSSTGVQNRARSV
jgi:hypothetical protein